MAETDSQRNQLNFANLLSEIHDSSIDTGASSLEEHLCAIEENCVQSDCDEICVNTVTAVERLLERFTVVWDVQYELTERELGLATRIACRLLSICRNVQATEATLQFLIKLIIFDEEKTFQLIEQYALEAVKSLLLSSHWNLQPMALRINQKLLTRSSLLYRCDEITLIHRLQLRQQMEKGVLGFRQELELNEFNAQLFTKTFYE